MLDPDDPIHAACDFLLPESKYELLDIVKVNEFLHREAPYNPWPDFLIAFASNGCGDYFAYDLRTEIPSVIYMDPLLTVDENLQAQDKLMYSSFDTWYHSEITQQEDAADSCAAAAPARGGIRDLRTVRSLVATLEDKDSTVQIRAARALGELGDAGALASLIAKLEKKDWLMRKASASALGKIGDNRAVESLTTALEKDRDEEVRSAAAEALQAIKAQD
jgi:hypothetical protein